MLTRILQNVLVSPADFQPSSHEFSVVGTFNPAAADFGEQVVLMVRVVERPRGVREGKTGLPRWDQGQGPVIDWVPNESLDFSEPRVIRQDGVVRLPFVSHLRIVYSADGRSVDNWRGARFDPQEPYEEFGVEDPRITKIGDVFYITYVAVSRHGVATALASTRDFRTFERQGIIFYPENKDVVLFPEQIGGRYFALHRPTTNFSKPEMWVAQSLDLLNWGGHQPLVDKAPAWASARVGAGAPPIRTAHGWLEVYHGSRLDSDSCRIGTYSAGAMLLGLDDPATIISRSREFILTPEAEFEKQGYVPNVVFPTGMLERGDHYLIYYGAADACCAVVEVSRDELLGLLD